MRIDLALELLTDVSLSASSRTVGEARCLDHFPGRALLGAAARVLYGQDHPRCFDIFQRGTVRFTDAVPLVDGFRVAPTPRTWQKSKYGTETHDLSAGKAPAGNQFKGQGDVWRDRDRQPVPIVRHTTLRAAMRPSGQTRDGFLYAMESLPAGLVLHAYLEGPDEDVTAVGDALCRESIFIGRSRGAEYGRVRVQPLDAQPEDLQPGKAGDVHTLYILCRSRVCFRSTVTGMPSFEPNPQMDFGLPEGWVLDPARTVIRTEAYSPFNGARRRPDLEQQVLQRGCVLTFTAGPESAPVNPATIAAHTSAGVGIWRNGGLGEISVQPDWLGQAEPRIPVETAPSDHPPTEASPPNDDLSQWMMQRHEAATALMTSAADVERAAGQMAAWRVPASQWGEIRRIARDARLRGVPDDAFLGDIKRHVTTGVSSLARGWGRTTREGKAAELLVTKLGDTPSGMSASAWAEAVAARVVRIERQSGEEERR